MVMFFEPRVNFIESDQGFAVEVLGRVGLRYTEGSHSLFVDSEVLVGPLGMLSTGRWRIMLAAVSRAVTCAFAVSR
jgi:hypothetical protein